MANPLGNLLQLLGLGGDEDYDDDYYEDDFEDDIDEAEERSLLQRRRDGRDVLSVRTAADLLMRRTSQSHSLHRSQDVLR